MKFTIDQAVASVQNAPGSMYTREDVISLLNRIETTTGKGIVIDRQIIKDLSEAILNTVQDNAQNLDSDYVLDRGSAEFSLRGNEIELDGIDIDTDQIAEGVVSGIYETIEEFFDELEEEGDTLEVVEE